LPPILEGIRGQVGDLVFKRYGDEVVISRKADPTGKPPSEAQLAHRERFREAALYGKLVMADPSTTLGAGPERKALYEEAAAAKGQPVFSLTVVDFPATVLRTGFNAPAVGEVDLSAYAGAVGDVIAVRASDDFDVTGVSVTLTDAGGAALESGQAVETPPDSGRWVYTATSAAPTGTDSARALTRLAVQATDMPGGVSAQEAGKTV